MDLFRNRNFAFGNAAGFLSAIARGGVMIILIMLLQGIWLPLHGYSFESTPFWAGVYMLPLTIGFVIMGPISGLFSDKYGPRWISTVGMLLVAVSFVILALLPYNFDYLTFAVALFIMGIGNGMFASPNSAAIMNSVPPCRAGCRIRHDVDPDELRVRHQHGNVLHHHRLRPDKVVPCCALCLPDKRRCRPLIPPMSAISPDRRTLCRIPRV